VRADVHGELAVDGFITFVYVDEAGKSRPHGITIEANTPEEVALHERAKAL
jgi:acyl-CoA hydrolase